MGGQSIVGPLSQALVIIYYGHNRNINVHVHCYLRTQDLSIHVYYHRSTRLLGVASGLINNNVIYDSRYYVWSNHIQKSIFLDVLFQKLIYYI